MTSHQQPTKEHKPIDSPLPTSTTGTTPIPGFELLGAFIKRAAERAQTHVTELARIVQVRTGNWAPMLYYAQHSAGVTGVIHCSLSYEPDCFSWVYPDAVHADKVISTLPSPENQMTQPFPIARKLDWITHHTSGWNCWRMQDGPRGEGRILDSHDAILVSYVLWDDGQVVKERMYFLPKSEFLGAIRQKDKDYFDDKKGPYVSPAPISLHGHEMAIHIPGQTDDRGDLRHGGEIIQPGYNLRTNGHLERFLAECILRANPDFPTDGDTLDRDRLAWRLARPYRNTVFLETVREFEPAIAALAEHHQKRIDEKRAHDAKFYPAYSERDRA